VQKIVNGLIPIVPHAERLALPPTLTADAVALLLPLLHISEDKRIVSIESDPKLVIYRPNMARGSPSDLPRLAYISHLAISLTTDPPHVKPTISKIFIDAHTGDLLTELPSEHSALYRAVFDAQRRNYVWIEYQSSFPTNNDELNDVLLTSKSIYELFENLAGLNSYNNASPYSPSCLS